MDNSEEKSIVKIDGEGNVTSCAKGLDTGCGYKSGAKMCGKCGAMAVEVKGSPKKIDTNKPTEEDIAATVPGESPETDADAGVGMEREMDEEAIDADQAAARISGTYVAKKKAGKKKRLEDMGTKSLEDDDDDLYLCSSTREIKSLSTNAPCEDCPGGCFSLYGDEFDLLSIEGIAEETLNGKAIDSSYSVENDMFAVQIEQKDGQVVEAYFNTDAELDAWFRVPTLEVSSINNLVSAKDAASAALETVPGNAVDYSVGEIEGEQAYSIHVDGLDGKSYDVYVSSVGEVLGVDEFEWDNIEEKELDVEEKELDVEELEFKGDYSEEARQTMADEGEALPDGSYPIGNEADLKDAIAAFGRAKDPEKAKAHIMKRANQLNLENLIPEKWTGTTSPDAETKSAEEDFAVTLLEFQMFAVEEEVRDILGD